MDADGRIIPIVEDDQGEGYKDPLELDDIMDLYSETLEEHREELYAPLKHLVKEEFIQQELFKHLDRMADALLKRCDKGA